MINPLFLHRIAHRLCLRRVRKIPTLLQHLNRFLTSCDIHPEARIGQRVRFQHHGLGVVIHRLSTIGDDVLIMPHVVLGQNVRSTGPVPLQAIVIGNNVLLGAGAKIIASGRLEIGDSALIGANAVVTQSVPPHCTAVGVPARLIPPSTHP